MRALGGFVAALKVKYRDIEVGFEFDVERGLADSGDLDNDLSDLFLAVAEAASARGTAVVLFVDELQYVEEEQLASMLMALHRASQSSLPITMVSAGLPQVVGLSGRAKSYAERLFEFVLVDRLADHAARDALCLPAERERVLFDPDAVHLVLARTQGYPYFIQEWGRHCWDIAEASPIDHGDAEQATLEALTELDNSFFRVRFDRLTPAEKQYLRAMADLGAGPHRSADIAERLERRINSVAPTRSSLINKGMIYSPAHGDTAFTVPLFDGFMKRIMPTL